VPSLPRIIHIGRIYPQQNWAMQDHVHEQDSELIFIMAGCLEARMSGKVYRAHRGDVLVYPRGVLHSEMSVGRQPLETRFIVYVPEPDTPEPPRHGHDQHGRIEMLLHWMTEFSLGQDGPGAEMPSLLFQAVLHELEQVQRSPGDQLQARLQRFLQNHLTEPMTLDDLAQAMGMTKFHFVRKFRECSGVPPMAYLRRMRVNAAETLLLNTDMPLKAIAPQVGFGDEYHLSRVFRKENGISPSLFRRQRALAAERVRLEDA